MTIGLGLRLLVVMGLWAACFPLITVGLDLAPHVAFAAMRATIAGACLLTLALVLGRPAPRGARVWALVALTGLGATTLGFLGMFHAAEFISAGLATVIANVQPLFAAVLAYLFLGERLGARGAAGMILGFAGIVAIAWPWAGSEISEGYALGLAYVVLAATGVAIGNVAMKCLVRKVDALMAMGFQLLLGGIPLGLASLLTEDPLSITWSTDFVVVLVGLSVFGTSLAFAMWFACLEPAGLSKANAFTFLVPVFGLAIGVALLEERLGWVETVGALSTLTGIVLVQGDARREPA